jgi:hypothetical protein
MNIKLIKLTNGEELVGDLTVKKGKLQIKNPAKFIISHDGIGMMPFLPLTTDKEIEIDESLLMLTANLDPEVESGYRQKFGDGLVLPSSTLKLTTD